MAGVEARGTGGQGVVRGWLDGRGWASGTEYQRRAEGAARAKRGEIRKGEI